MRCAIFIQNLDPPTLSTTSEYCVFAGDFEFFLAIFGAF